MPFYWDWVLSSLAAGMPFLGTHGVKQRRAGLQSLPPFAAICWIATGLIAFFLLGVAVTTPPTNWDSMSYHLPRVLHWLQQRSVDHFPTDNIRELEFGPWSGFVQAHLFLLCGSDRLVNLPQWLAMAASCLLVSYLTGRLGQLAGLWKEDSAPTEKISAAKAQALSAFFVVTVPMGMMQSMTPQTDYLTTLWLVCLCVFVVDLSRGLQLPVSALGVALACGLGALTKSTFYIYAAPFVLICGIRLCQTLPLWSSRLKVGAAMASVFVVLNAPHMLRNYCLLGSPMGSAAVHYMVCNEKVSPAVFASNFVRNLALHNNCGIPPVTRWLNAVALKVHGWTGQALDDPRTTYPPGPVQFFEKFVIWDDYASAPAHILAVMLALALAMVRWRDNQRLLAYFGLILMSVCLFLGLLKYQV